MSTGYVGGFTHATLVVFGAILVVPDPSMMLSILVAIVCLPVVGYAVRDGSLQELQWGIAALYAVGIVVSILESVGRESLLNAGLHDHALVTAAVLPVCALVGTYLTIRRRGAPDDVPLLS